jgi:hypothetical protein
VLGGGTSKSDCRCNGDIAEAAGYVISIALNGLLSKSNGTLPLDGGGNFIPGGYPFILLVGTFTSEQATDILDGFFGMVMTS